MPDYEITFSLQGTGTVTVYDVEDEDEAKDAIEYATIGAGPLSLSDLVDAIPGAEWDTDTIGLKEL
jgi:hypothetical protein